MDVAELLGHKIHEQILAEGIWGRKVGFPAGDLADLLHEGDQVVVAGQHEGVDEDPRSTARHDFAKRLVDNVRV